MKLISFVGLLLLTSCMNNNSREKFDYLMFGEIKPGGWISTQMENDLAGFTGHLDELAPDLIAKDDIRNKPPHQA